MSQVTIPELPQNAGLIGTELLEISNAGTSEKISIDNLASIYQNVTLKDMPFGYAGLDVSGEIDVNQLPMSIPASNIADSSVDNTEYQSLSGVTGPLQTQLNEKEITTNKNIPNGYAGLDANTLLSISQIPLQIPAANIADGTVDNTEYQYLSGVTSAIQGQLNAKEEIINKGAVSGYAGLDANTLLLLSNFPTGNAQEFLRRNNANNALEFTTIDVGEIDSINGDTTPAQIFLAGTGLDIDDASETHTYSIDGTVVTLADSQTLLNKTMDGIDNTFSNIDETQQTVSVGAVDTVLTSNGPANAPTYQVASKQSPWLDTINANQQNLSDLKILTFSSNGSLGPSDRTIFGTINGMGFNVPENDAFTFAVFSTSEFSISTTQIDCHNNQLVNAALYTGVSVTDSLEWLQNIRQTFNPGTNNAGFNVGSNGTNPDTPQNGDLFYDSTVDVLKAYIKGVWVSFEASTISSISELNTSISVADTGTNGIADFVIDGNSTMQMNSIRTALNHRFELKKATTTSSFAAGVATLNNEGNLFTFTNINGTFSSLDTTNWQAGSIVYLQFPSANTSGVILVHGAGSSAPNASFWLLNEVNYTVNDSNFRQILSFIYDGVFWVQQSFGEVASSTATQTPWLSPIDGDRYTLDNAVIHFTNDPRAAPTSTEYAMYATNTTTPNALIINWPVNVELRMHVNGVEEYTFDNNLIQMHGNSLQDISDIQDEHSNEQLAFAFVADAENYIKITNASSSNPARFETDGTDTNVGLVIGTKGNGMIEVESDVMFDENFKVVKRIIANNGSDVASATQITVGDGNYFKISGNTDISFMNELGWFSGSTITLEFLGTLNILNQTAAPPPSFRAFALGTDLAVNAGDTLTVTYDGTFWRRTANSDNSV